MDSYMENWVIWLVCVTMLVCTLLSSIMMRARSLVVNGTILAFKHGGRSNNKFGRC